MDVKVDVTNVLPGSHPATCNAGVWLREHLGIPPNCTIFKEYEEYFNCRIDVADRKDYWMEPNKVVFETNKDLLAFVLKWS